MSQIDDTLFLAGVIIRIIEPLDTVSSHFGLRDPQNAKPLEGPEPI